MNKTLRIVAWNANGLLQHIQELEIFLKLQNIDICLISETHFTKSSYCKLRGYSFYHALHPDNKAKGGSAIFVKDNIQHNEELKIEKVSMQVSTIKVHLSKTKSYSISAIYCPPRYNLKQEEYVAFLKTLGSEFIIGGDFNAKNIYWGSRLTTTKGKELFAAGQQLKCEFHSGSTPTYWPTDINKTPDLIDFFLTRGISWNYIHVENDASLSSDHSPVIMTLSQTIIKKEVKPKLTNNKTNWELFQTLIQEKTNLRVPIHNSAQLEDELDKLIENIQSAAWDSTPSHRRETNQNATYPEEVRELIKSKRKARKNWQRNRTPAEKRLFNNLCNKLKTLIKEIKNQSVNRYLSNLTGQKDSDYSLWKATKALKRPNLQIPPIKNNDTWARNPKQKAELFANHLEETFQPYPRQTAEEDITPVEKIDDQGIRAITLQELKWEIKNNLNAKKAPGYDLIMGQVIKALPERGMRKLLHIMNAAIRLRYVPRQWKVAEVIMILKSNKPPNEKSSYRPISLLPTLSKVFEKLLLKRLKLILEERNLIPPHQFGFREKHSTIEQVHRITDVIEKSLETKHICSGIFLDVAQAFDKVWHQGLAFKLQRDLPRQFYELLKSYISDRHFRVKYENDYSGLKKITAGVPQGSVLGPILYLLYTRDMPSTDATIATFADDTAILATAENITDSTNKLQRATNKIYNWTKKWRIKLNENKSTCINFTNLRVEHIPIMINSQKVPYANTAKYLGMTLDAKLRWKEHIKKKREELNIKFRKMHWLLGRHSELSIHNKLMLYKQILKPVWVYGIQLWGCAKKTNIKIIQTFQNKILRSIVNAPWYIRNDNLHRDLKMELVADEIKNHARKHLQRLHEHENQDLRCMMTNTTTITRRLQRTKPLDLM